MAQSENEHVDLISAAQCRAARAYLAWTQTELSRRSTVGLSAIKDFEGGNRRTHSSIRSQLRRTFEDAGVEFPNAHTVSGQPE
jgi:predicted transcriptional regulator